MATINAQLTNKGAPTVLSRPRHKDLGWANNINTKGAAIRMPMVSPVHQVTQLKATCEKEITSFKQSAATPTLALTVLATGPPNTKNKKILHSSSKSLGKPITFLTRWAPNHVARQLPNAISAATVIADKPKAVPSLTA